MAEEQKEKIEFQYVMNYKAYRREAIACRILLTLVIAVGLAGLCALSVVLGAVLAGIALCFGGISIVVVFAAEQTYTVYNTRIVLKRRNSEKRTSVPMDSVVKVGYKRAWYEKDLGTGTIAVTAKTEKGGTKKYRMRHVFNGLPAVEFIQNTIAQRGFAANEDRK